MTHLVALTACRLQQRCRSALALAGDPKSLLGGTETMAHEQFQSCIDACIRCAEECELCANACLDERNIQKLAECIRLDRDCAAICWLAASLMSGNSRFAHDICRVCAEICDSCGMECAKHELDHCQKCAHECQRCADECRKMAGVAA